jgi:hypothetical protein
MFGGVKFGEHPLDLARYSVSDSSESTDRSYGGVFLSRGEHCRFVKATELKEPRKERERQTPVVGCQCSSVMLCDPNEASRQRITEDNALATNL